MPENDRSHLPWVMSPSGKRWYPTDPRPEDFEIEDIATNLSNINRFNGAIPYSVAAHSVSVAEYLRNRFKRPDLAFQGLMHDAAEAVVGDMVSPLKELIPEFSAIEGKVWNAIALRFDLPKALDPLVTVADKEIAAVEAFHAFSHMTKPSEQWWDTYRISPAHSYFFGWHPNPEAVRQTGDVTKNQFLTLFEDLTKNA